MRKRYALLLLTLLALAVLPAPVIGDGWSAIGPVGAGEWDGHILTFRAPQGTLSVTPLSPDVVRVRFLREEHARDHSYAVVNRELGAPEARIEFGAADTKLSTPSLRVTIRHAPLRIAFADAAGESLDEDDDERGMSLVGAAFRVSKRLRDDEQIYGFGEKTGRLNKRGWALGGYHYTMWNSDTYAYDSGTDPLYVSVPFYIVVRQGKAHGLFLDNPGRSTFDVGREAPGILAFGAATGEMDYYFIHGPHPKQVIERYTALTGRMPLPPRWALGFHQCRWSYFPESRVRLLANNFREKRIPADVIWLDIHYLSDYTPFTWSAERFPDPKKLISDLRAGGFRVITIIDPHPKKEPGSSVYEKGLAGGHFVKRPDGSVFEGNVWPSRAEKNPGPSVFPDFTRAATREWWGSLYKDLLDVGVAGIWNDMNEPAVFQRLGLTMPLDLRHDNAGQPTDHRSVHNVYGQLMSRATFEGLMRLRPNTRPFVLTRASYAGGQRYAAVWPGDNTADWSSLRQSLSMLMGMGLSGFSFVGSDIGGFAHAPSGELFTRWLQVAVFYPFMRAHTEQHTPEQEPWSYGPRHEVLNRQAIELRYELLPHIYNEMARASETGVPAMRPLFLEFPEDEPAMSIDDEFLFGSNLLVAPVLRERVWEQEVYLPAGDWFDYWTGRRFGGGARVKMPVELSTIPLFVRSGGFVFRQPVVQHTGEMAGQPLRVLVAPAAQSSATLYEDDGETLDYRKGVFLRRRFEQTRDSRGVTIIIGAPEGSYRPAERELRLEVWTSREPKSVSLRVAESAETRLPRVSAAELTKTARGWSLEEGLLVVKGRDRFEPTTILIAE